MQVINLIKRSHEHLFSFNDIYSRDYKHKYQTEKMKF